MRARIKNAALAGALVLAGMTIMAATASAADPILLHLRNRRPSAGFRN
jgi:hypothetical protein